MYENIVTITIDRFLVIKSLVPHQNLRNINLHLKTIDDLFILLDGLVPNIQTMIIQLCQKRILCKLIIETNINFFCLSLHSSKEYLSMSSIK